MKHNKLLLALVLTGSLMAGCSSAPAETKKDTEPVQSETAKSDTKEKDTKKTEKSQKPASSTAKTETPAKSGSTTAKAPAKSNNSTVQAPAKSDNTTTTTPTTPSGNNSGNSGSAAQSQPSTQPAAQPTTPAQTDTVVGVSDVLANPQAYVGKTITVEGQLPQGMVGDGKIVAYPAGYMPSGSAAEIAANQLELSGNIDEGNCVADLTGVLEASGDGYVFDVQNLQVVEQFTAGAAGGAVE